MKTLKVIYNNETKYILDIANKFSNNFYVEPLNTNVHKEKRKAKQYQEDFGSSNLPLIIIEDENLIGINAIWSENNPDWEDEINKILNE